MIECRKRQVEIAGREARIGRRSTGYFDARIRDWLKEIAFRAEIESICTDRR
jgi:hypothetical protein